MVNFTCQLVSSQRLVLGGALFDLDVVSRYRAQIYGMLALWIVALHIFMDYRPDFTCGTVLLLPIAWIIACGTVAVDAFLLISGISLCWAYEKKQSLGQFWLRRFVRVFPAALIIYGAYWLVSVAILRGDWGRFIWQCTFLNPLITDRETGNWFIPGVLVMYLCYPAFHSLFCESEHRTRNLVCAILACYALCGLFNVYAHEWFHVTEIIITRFPVFMLGTYLGPLVREGRKLPLWLVPILVVFVLLDFADDYLLESVTWMWRIGLFTGGIAVAYLLGIILDLVAKSGLAEGALSPVWRFFGWVGGFSLELYCAHQVIRWSMVALFGFDTWGNAWLMLLALYAVSIPVAWGVNRLVAYLRGVCEEKRFAAQTDVAEANLAGQSRLS